MGKPVNGSVVEGISGTEDALAVVDGIRLVLCFQTDGVLLLWCNAVFEGRLTITKEIGSIDLHTGHVGKAIHGISVGAYRSSVPKGQTEEVLGNGAVENEVGIVPIQIVSEPCAYGLERAEIIGRAGNIPVLSRRNELTVDERDAVGMNLHLMGKDRAGADAAQIEIGMVGQIDGRIVIGDGHVFHEDGGIADTIGNSDIHIAGIAFFAGRAVIGQQEGRVIDDARVPQNIAEAAVQMIVAVILFQLIVLSVEGKSGIFDTVGDAPDEGALRAAVRKVPGKRVIAANEIHTVKNQRLNTTSVVQDSDAQGTVVQGIKVYGPAVGEMAEQGLFHKKETPFL